MIKVDTIESIIKQIIEISKSKLTKAKDEGPLTNKDILKNMIVNTGQELLL